MEPNKLKNSRYFYTLSAIWSTILSISYLIIVIIISISIKRFNVMFAAMINLFVPTLVVFISQKFTNIIFNYGKKDVQKKQIILLAMCLFVIKYIIIVIPLLIGLIVNLSISSLIFNPFVLVIGALIYPMATLIVQWYFVKGNHKEK
ncbi:MAG: hypothetical protein LBP70_00765 [Mycoplasmataceae bacterium]|nr:hypothetical protein [Mycoplasmataceae bacterium]